MEQQPLKVNLVDNEVQVSEATIQFLLSYSRSLSFIKTQIGPIETHSN